MDVLSWNLIYPMQARWAAAKAKQALQGAHGLSAFSGTSESAVATFERAEAKIVAAERAGSISMNRDITADDALQQKFAAMEHAVMEELIRKALTDLTN
jgi:phage shock protein A